MRCRRSSGLTGYVAVWYVSVFGKKLATGYEWKIGEFPHTRAHALVTAWNREQSVCSYEVRHD